MDVLLYNELEPRRAKEQFARVVKMLEADDFAAAEVKKMTPTAFYRARLNDSDRLLFSIMRYQSRGVILLLEIIYNHEYEKSRFLQGAYIDENKISPLRQPEELRLEELPELSYRNPKQKFFYILDKIISFDDLQQELLHLRPPCIIIGSAGSGKTVLTLEKLKSLNGDILYVTRSAFLAENARRLYYSFSYDKTNQEIDFLAFDEVLRNLKVPEGQSIGYQEFVNWAYRNRDNSKKFDIHQLYEEISGVLTSQVNKNGVLSLEEYLQLGIKQSIFPEELRPAAYEVFERFYRWLQDNHGYTSNLLSHQYLPLAKPSYDFLVVDEVQDLTCIQLFLLLKLLRNPFNFILCGDANQIVHPNFFSWAQVKSLFYKEKIADRSSEIHLLQANYRNSQQITELANQLLRWKFARFGSVDRESNFLVNCNSPEAGEVNLLPDKSSFKQELNQMTMASVHFAVIVLRQEDKAEARNYFKTPLVFSIAEAKGLEYQNIIIYKLISFNSREFDEIAADLHPDDLQGELQYRRIRDKSDRSLEIFKFFINALYVAVTRAIKRIYWVESRVDHPAFRLLKLNCQAQQPQIKEQKSSVDEWRLEAKRLASQGKTEQADDIHRQILKTVPVPWEVYNLEKLPELLAPALDYRKFNRKAKQTLLDYDIAYDMSLFRNRLFDTGYAFAKREADAEAHYRSNYLVLYNTASRKKLLGELQRYGVDFRDPFNRTPLMLACVIGDAELIEQLLEMNASPELLDNYGASAFHYLWRYLMSKNCEFQPFRNLYHQLQPNSIQVKIGDRQIKISNNCMEFFLLNFILAHLRLIFSLGKMYGCQQKYIESGSFLIPAAKLPEFILPEYRKKRSYISSILSKNELQRPEPHNRQLFKRVYTGQYILNPQLQLLDGQGAWKFWDELLGIKYFQDWNQQPEFASLYIYLQFYRQHGKTIPFDLCDIYSVLGHLVAELTNAKEKQEKISPVKEKPNPYSDDLDRHLTQAQQQFHERILQTRLKIMPVSSLVQFGMQLAEELPTLPETLQELRKLRGKNTLETAVIFNNAKEMTELIKKIANKKNELMDPLEKSLF
ncbi:MAG: hypothetical protein WCT05_04240 [Lentisphaeria bacterium]